MRLIFLILLLPIFALGLNLKEDLTVDEFYQTYEKNKNKPSYFVLDVRTMDEFKSGHLEKSVLIDVKSSDFETKVGKLDKAKTYLIYCRSGKRSRVALDSMKKLGFKKVFHLNGGINEWIAKGYKIIQ